MVSGQLPSPPLFWLLAKLAELFPTEACLPLGKGRKILEGSELARIRAEEFSARRPPTLEGARRAGAGTYNPLGQQPNAREKQVMTGRSSATDRQHRNSRPRSGRPIVLAQRAPLPRNPRKSPTAWTALACRAHQITQSALDAGTAVRRQQPPTAPGHPRRTARPPKRRTALLYGGRAGAQWGGAGSSCFPSAKGNFGCSVVAAGV
ncbi:hypothetical protein ARZXY2_4861 (plasmid) [Arthrobacter sp. ZXY-2]|nr:hypothetical protein ARZXY2_4861 [Arthrobacter sp. ZXY-2]